ncbi:MAG: single-stranded-DNA-specific exonuclease RecJ [Burkholderiales bacterium]|nr:single-stranded-DNA-specific exonuclease RecJ [Burkholderiales bacterium]
MVQRSYPRCCFDSLCESGYPPLFARIYAARGVSRREQLAHELSSLIPPAGMKGANAMARLLADAIATRKRILILADYDADGATACAVAVRALREFGATVDYLVPNRFEYGYGLTPEIVALAAQRNPDLLLTVDNGIASVEGVQAAVERGIAVLITDHHLPGDLLPDAHCIVNPNQPGCEFPSKHLAGVGVIFYVMLALRAELRQRGAFNNSNPFFPDPRPWADSPRKEPNLACLLDLVALGTVADVVKLDDNNRILVHHGLARIRTDRACPGITALLHIARREARKAGCYELGFMLGPRLNAAGRLADMSLGIECLLSDSEESALALAAQLDALNHERRAIEGGMQESALAALATSALGEPGDSHSISLFRPDWHQGVIGIVASRLKDKLHRPAFAFARANGSVVDGILKGSGRSIPALHLRDALDLIAKRHPGLLIRFGGHAAAAGATLRERDFERFCTVFEQVARSLLTAADLERVIETDGSLDDHDICLDTAALLAGHIWGQGFPQTAFHDRFTVENQRLVGDQHLKLKLRKPGKAPGAAADTTTSAAAEADIPCGESFDGMLFFCSTPLPGTIDAIYRLDVNEYKGARCLQLIVEHWKDADSAVPFAPAGPALD